MNLESVNIKKSLCNTQQITFEITERCNLRCYYCGYGSFYSNRDSRENRDLNIGYAIRFLEYMRSLWKSKYSDSDSRDIYISFYGGEPLLNMHFIVYIINYIETELKNTGRNFHYTMTTNAILLHRHMDYLIEKNFEILISLDGDELGSSYRVFPNGKPIYKLIIDNINKLRLKYPLFYDSNLNFNAVLHNKNSIENLQSFFLEKFNKVPLITELNISGIKKDKETEFFSMFQNTEESLFKSENYSQLERQLQFNSPTYKSAALYLLHYSPFKYDNYNELLYGNKLKTKSMPTGTCLPFAKKVFITVSGKILPCERIGHQYALGLITPEKVNLSFSHIAKMYNKFYSTVVTQCNKCYAKKGCTQCIFFLHNLTDSSTTFKCNGFMNKDQFNLYKNKQLAFFARNPECYAQIMNNLKIR